MRILGSELGRRLFAPEDEQTFLFKEIVFYATNDIAIVQWCTLRVTKSNGQVNGFNFDYNRF